MNDKEKKQVPLRISQSLWNELSAWAGDEFRSLNGQIEYLLTECVKRRKKGDGGGSGGGGSGADGDHPGGSETGNAAGAGVSDETRDDASGADDHLSGN